MDSVKEYRKRAAELERFLKEADYPVKTVLCHYDPKSFYAACRGLENEPEGGSRCLKCYEMRLTEAAKFAAENEFGYYCTTLSISPLKDSEKINQIGERVGIKYGIKWLPSDFKKKDGFKRSVNYRKSTDYTGRIIAAVYIPGEETSHEIPD